MNSIAVASHLWSVQKKAYILCFDENFMMITDNYKKKNDFLMFKLFNMYEIEIDNEQIMKLNNFS